MIESSWAVMEDEVLKDVEIADSVIDDTQQPEVESDVDLIPAKFEGVELSDNEEVNTHTVAELSDGKGED